MRTRLLLAALLLAALVPGGAHASRQVAVSIHSAALRGNLRATIVLPADYDTSGDRYPVVYFLHGLPAGPNAYEDVAWLRTALDGSEQQAILVQPQGARSGDSDPEYLDWGPGRNWETFLAQELPRWVDAHYRTIANRSGRAIVGLSAGGYGAAMVGFNHLGRFSVIESWSGYFHATDASGSKAIAAPPHANVHTLVARFAAWQRRHPTTFDFYVGGGDDRVRDENEQLHRELVAAHVQHLFQVVPGGHSRAVWSAHAVEWLQLGLVRLAPEQP